MLNLLPSCRVLEEKGVDVRRKGVYTAGVGGNPVPGCNSLATTLRCIVEDAGRFYFPLRLLLRARPE